MYTKMKLNAENPGALESILYDLHGKDLRFDSCLYKLFIHRLE